jgi:hypothetical protein
MNAFTLEYVGKKTIIALETSECEGANSGEGIDPLRIFCSRNFIKKIFGAD